MSTKRNRRSVEEIIAEREAQLEALRVKQALSDAQSSPELAPIVDALKNVRDARTAYKKGFSTGPQSYESRLTSHKLWIDEIQADRDVALEAVSILDDQEDRLKELLADMAARLSNGEDISDEASGVLAEFIPVENYESVENLAAQAEAAKVARQTFLALKKAPKREKKAEAES